MKNTKKHYVVRLMQKTYEFGGGMEEKIIKEVETWAVSEKRAISNAKYRIGIYDYNSCVEAVGDSLIKKYYEAYEI